MGKTQKIRTQNDPTYSPHKLRNQNRNRKNKFKKHRKSFWKFQEEKLYVQYLQNNHSQFNDLVERKRNKVFMHMARFIKIRGPDQCRSHHQKMKKKYGTLVQIIEGIKQNKFSSKQYICPQVISTENDIQTRKKYIQIQDQLDQKPIKEVLIQQKFEVIQKKKCFQDLIWNVLDPNTLIDEQTPLS